MQAAEFYAGSFDWSPQGPVSWKSHRNGDYPDNAVNVGHDTGNRILVARAKYQGALLPGKLHTTHTTCYVAFDGKEIGVPQYEVLVAPRGALKWVPSSDGQRVPTAVVGGVSETGEQLFIGRCQYRGAHVSGKIHPSHKTLYIPYDGNEIGQRSYEILVQQSPERLAGNVTSRPSAASANSGNLADTVTICGTPSGSVGSGTSFGIPLGAAASGKSLGIPFGAAASGTSLGIPSVASGSLVAPGTSVAGVSPATGSHDWFRYTPFEVLMEEWQGRGQWHDNPNQGPSNAVTRFCSSMLTYTSGRQKGQEFHRTWILQGRITSENLSSERTNFSRQIYGHQMEAMGKVVKDERGHLLADSLGGPIVDYNLAPQASTINRNEHATHILNDDWFTVERKIRDYLQQNPQSIVLYTVLVNYSQNELRPRGFRLHVEFDGKPELTIDSYTVNGMGPGSFIMPH